LRRDAGFLWRKRKISLPVLILFLLGTSATVMFMPEYWRFDPPRLSADISTGLTDDGHPWIGAEKPNLVITEFTDYQCFQCRKMHYFLRQLISDHPKKIRLVHRHFPMDHQYNPIVNEPFHVGSGKMALLAITAVEMGHFWQMNDALFEAAANNQNINLQKLAQEVGLSYSQLARGLNHRTIKNRLRRDIISGMKLQINGTPAFVIDDYVYLAQIPPEVIRKALQ
jgi:protein-disulfide isomerase